MAARILAVIERDYPATAQAQYGDLFYFCVGIRTQFGSMDLVLRGSAVTCALNAPDTRTPRRGNDTATNHPAPQQYLRTLIRTGVRVWADDADLTARGDPDGTLLNGVVAADTDALAVRWHEYQEVWFL